MPEGKSLPEEERRVLRDLLQALEPFTEMRNTMPLQYVVAFLHVAMEENLGVGEYAARTGQSSSVMSRHILDIGPRNRYMEEGFGLVEQRQDPLELRRHRVRLTPKGVALAHKIARALRK